MVVNLVRMFSLLTKKPNQKKYLRQKLIKISRGKMDKEVISFTKAKKIPSLQRDNIEMTKFSRTSPRFEEVSNAALQIIL